MNTIKVKCMRNGYIKIYILLKILIFLAFPFRVESEDNNLLTNGDFEDKPLTGWKKEIWNDGGKIESTDEKVYNGKYAIKISSGTIENDVRLIQEVQVEPESYYRLSGMIATESVQEGKIGANICITMGFDYAGNVTGTQDWKYYELKFKTSKSHYLIKIGVRLGMYYNTVKGTAYFDDIRLEKLDYAPKYCIILKEPGNPEEQKKQISNDQTKNNQKKKIQKRDPVFSQINLPLILILVSIGLGPVILNVFLTILREKKHGHTQ